jgi:hypothetical protein
MNEHWLEQQQTSFLIHSFACLEFIIKSSSIVLHLPYQVYLGFHDSIFIVIGRPFIVIYAIRLFTIQLSFTFGSHP